MTANQRAYLRAYLHCDLPRNQIINAVFDFGLHYPSGLYADSRSRVFFAKQWPSVGLTLVLFELVLYCRQFRF